MTDQTIEFGRVCADEGALGVLSTGEALAAVLVLDHKDLLGDYTCWKPSNGSGSSGCAPR